MPEVNFPEIDETAFSLLDPGKYPAQLTGIEMDETSKGDEMWNLTFTVISGPAEGRKVFDRMVFSDKAINRVKLICSRLGLDVTQKTNLTPDKIDGRRAMITVTVEKYIDKNGNEAMRNNIPFDGYESLNDDVVPF